MEGFTWHRVSDGEREEISRQAKSLMDDFGKKLDKVKAKEEFFESGDGLRDEGDGWETSAEFRGALFSNAPLVDDDELIAEKGGWGR